ncbi:hypothetical protein DWX74_07405 [Peptoclostridium sp. AF21-18]|nr:hypothetical protein DWX74_07405 [Peptoclostridium sp. AF21-18]
MKITTKEVSKLIKNLIWVFCISLVAFYFIKIPTEIYVFIILGTLIYILIEYSISKNLVFYLNIMAYYVVNIFSFLIVNIFLNRCMKYPIFSNIKIELFKINLEQNKEVLKILLIPLILFLVIVILFNLKNIFKSKVHNKINNRLEDKKELFEERKEDLKRLEKYLNDFNIVGIDGDWGSGKSFLTDHLEGYIKIKIDLLACNEDDIQIVVLNELDKLLKNQRIFSSYSPKLKKILRKERFFENIGDVLVNDDTLYSDVLTGLAKDLDKIDGTILIIYEDLDRVEDTNVIKKILGISEKISSSKVKILHQFSGKNLKLKGINRDYLEKYIPFILNITEIQFNSILKYLLKMNKYKNCKLKIEDFNFFGFDTIDVYIGSKYYFTIRKIEHFLDETISVIEEQDRYMKNKSTVIALIFIKHFCEDIYIKIIPGESLLDTFLLEYNKEKGTVEDWITYCEYNDLDIEKILIKKENKIPIFIFEFFGYKFANENAELELKLKNQNINREKDRIIWNIINSGKMEYTYYEKNTSLFMKEVINKTKEERAKSYEKFMNDYYDDEYSKRVMKFGKEISKEGEIFKSLNIKEIKNEEWIEVIDFYFEYYKVKTITLELIECLSYCDLTSRRNYIYILEKFNNLNIIGNLNYSYIYNKHFLIKYLKQIQMLGFCKTVYDLNYLYGLETYVKKPYELINSVLNPIKKRLNESYDNINIECVRNDIKIIINFIDKNAQLINDPRYYSSKDISKENLNDLDYITKEDKLDIFEIEKGYCQEIFTVEDIKKFIEKM